MIFTRIREYAMTALRLGVELALYLVGLLNLRAALARRPSGGPKRVAFQAYSTHLVQLYKTIVEELRAADDIQVEIIVLPHPQFPISSWLAVKPYAERELGIPARHIRFRWQTLWEAYDLVVYTDNYAKFPLRQTTNVFLCHGPGSQRRVFESSMLRKGAHEFDAILVNGPFDHELAIEQYGEKAMADKLFALGFPFLDLLKRNLEVSRADFEGRLALDPNKKTVLLAPHWSALKRIQGHQDNYFEQALEVLQALDINIVVKLHACTFNKAMVDNIDWSARVEELAQNPQIHIDPDVDDRPALRYSDILISDVSSRIYNFMLIGKPVIVYFPIEVDWRDELDKKRIELMHRGSWVARDPRELKQHLQERLELGAEGGRGDEVARECFSNPGRATEEVVQWVLKRLEYDGFVTR